MTPATWPREKIACQILETKPRTFSTAERFQEVTGPGLAGPLESSTTTLRALLMFQSKGKLCWNQRRFNHSVAAFLFHILLSSHAGWILAGCSQRLDRPLAGGSP